MVSGITVIAAAAGYLLSNVVQAVPCMCKERWSYETCINVTRCPAYACDSNDYGVTKRWCYVINPGCEQAHKSISGNGDWAYCEDDKTLLSNAFIGHFSQYCKDVTVESDDPYCWHHTTWAMATGFKTHPQYYVNFTKFGLLQADSPRIDFQCALSSMVGHDEAGEGHDCPVPCSSTMRTCVDANETTPTTSLETFILTSLTAGATIEGLSIGAYTTVTSTLPVYGVSAGAFTTTASPGSDLSWLWIVLAVILCLLCLGAAGFAAFTFLGKKTATPKRSADALEAKEADAALMGDSRELRAEYHEVPQRVTAPALVPPAGLNYGFMPQPQLQPVPQLQLQPMMYSAPPADASWVPPAASPAGASWAPAAGATPLSAPMMPPAMPPMMPPTQTIAAPMPAQNPRMLVDLITVGPGGQQFVSPTEMIEVPEGTPGAVPIIDEGGNPNDALLAASFRQSGYAISRR